MPHAAPTVASDPPTKAQTDTALSTLTGWINDGDTATATMATKATLKTFFQALQTALPLIQARLEPVDGTLDDLSDATDAVVTALS